MTTYPAPSDSVQAVTRADGTTSTHSSDHGNIIDIVVNAKQYLKGDGTTESAGQVTALQTASSGKRLYFPAGTYVFPSGTSFTPSGSAHIEGAGYRNSIIKTTNAYAFQMTASDGLSIRNIGTRLNTGSTSGGGLKLTSTGGSYNSGAHITGLESLGVSTSTDPVWDLDAFLLGKVEACRVADGGGDGIRLKSTSPGSNANYIQADLNNNTGYGITIYGGQGLTLHHSVYESNRAGGVRISAPGGVAHLRMVDLWLEGNGYAGASNANSVIYVDSSSVSVAFIVCESCKFFSYGGAKRHVHFDDGATGGPFVFENCRFQDAPVDSTTPFYFGNLFFGPIIFNGYAPNISDTSTWGGYPTGPGVLMPAPNNSDGIMRFGKNLYMNPDRGVFLDLGELASDPNAAAANRGVLYLRDSGGGKTQLCIRFNTGAVQVIATEP